MGNLDKSAAHRKPSLKPPSPGEELGPLFFFFVFFLPRFMAAIIAFFSLSQKRFTVSSALFVNYL